MSDVDWTQFRRLIYIDARKEDLYRMWATRTGMETFFLQHAPYADQEGRTRPPDEPCQAGDTYTWQWHNWEGEHTGSVLEANGRDKLVFDFENSIVEVRFREGRGMICVDLVQRNIPTDELSKFSVFHGSSCGWTFWLTNLKAVMEHGITLNDAKPGLLGEHRDMDVVNI
jgi:hypothetical protein